MRRRPLVVLVPVLARPHRVAPLLASLERATPEPHRCLFLPTPGDNPELEALRLAGAQFQEYAGNYAAKINAGIEATDEPLIFTGADDLAFHAGWLEAALEVMDETGAGVVGTQDRCNPRVIAGLHATHFLVAREYVERHGTIDEPGKLLHEGYAHEYVDDELIGTARARGQYAFAAEAVVEHLHPLVKKAPVDATYRLGRSRSGEGRALFRRRRRLWQG